ncbi:transcriptional regulator [Vibrio tasmaniensis ZS-17]|uniref:StbB family protein n=1 Tax=Vibrio tasmaniensis TaxID=212663 RepID=UPI0002DB8F5A|nr:StbB family protein [Vibrio tasmaniensis]OED65912.1 transcriptional regulator [Vibrio tasmaniensis ZS-17]
MFLKIAVMNNSGNVGKSMICDSLFLPRIPEAEVLKIETINTDGTNDNKLSAKAIGDVFKEMDNKDVCVIDIGSSNIETFMNNIENIEGSIEDIDYFFIPTTPKQKQQHDTVATIEKLISLGVEEDSIKIIFNFVDPDFDLTKQFPVIFDSVSLEGLLLKNPENQFVIEESQLFEYLGQTGYTFKEISKDDRDFKSLMREAKSKEDREALSIERMTKRFVTGFEKKLDTTFKKIVKACDIDVERVL